MKLGEEFLIHSQTAGGSILLLAIPRIPLKKE